MKIRNLIFIFVVLAGIAFTTTYVVFAKDVMHVSFQENRNLVTFENLDNTNFIDGSFQQTIEDAISDQFVYRYELVNFKKKLDVNLSSLFFPISDDEYIINKIGDTKVYRIGTSNYLMSPLIANDKTILQKVNSRIEQINDISKDYEDVNFYVYKPTQVHETSLFDEKNGVESYGPTLSNALQTKLKVPYAEFDIDTLDTYKKSFYATDHHWNYYGIHQGYSDIIELIFGNSEDIMQPQELICSEDKLFQGTFNSRTGYITEPEQFCIFTYDYPTYKVLDKNNKEIKNIKDNNQFKEYELETLDDQYFYNQAYQFYGNLTLWKNPDQSMKTIMVVGDSYSRPMIPLLLSHYSNVYYVNPFDYFLENWKYFDYDKFIQEKDIDDVLFMYTIENYYFGDNWDPNRYQKYDIRRTDEN